MVVIVDILMSSGNNRRNQDAKEMIAIFYEAYITGKRNQIILGGDGVHETACLCK